MSIGCPNVFTMKKLVLELKGMFDQIREELDQSYRSLGIAKNLEDLDAIRALSVTLESIIPDMDVVVRDYSKDERFTFRCHEVKGTWMLTLTTGGTRVLQIELSASQLEKVRHGLRVVDTREEV